MKSPIETFSEWVKNGKDDGMEKNHYEPVSKIIELINSTENKFNIIDAGCGNGWAVRLVANEKNCKSACGVDGSQFMIQKAKKNDPINNYIHANLNTWNPITKVDVVMSMEVFYYFKNPQKIINNIFNYWLNQNGRLIIGVDFYYENPQCHDWQKQTEVSIMNLLKIKEWTNLFKKAGFKDVKKHQFCASREWKGTLVVEGAKI